MVGLFLASIASFAAAEMFAGTHMRAAIPLLFIVVLYGLARRYGVVVAVAGSLLSAFVFAHFLFDPTGSWHVEDAAARTSLLWMVVGAVVLSYLLIPPSSERKDS